MIFTLKILCFLIIVTYVLYVLWMYLALLKERDRDIKITNDEVKISVIIAFRNEAENIIKCLESIKKQDYSTQNFEIILCNDHSEDNSIDLIREFISVNSQIKISLLENKTNEQGKKHAINNAVKKAQFDILAFTDADCEIGNNWLKCIAAGYQNKKIKMLCGPVIFKKQKSVFEKLMSLELASLIAVTAATILNKKPILCNAANMSVKKEIHLLYQEKIKESKYASGDDIFLLHYVNKNFGNESISFIYKKEALVYTIAPPDIKSFINQRIRWSSKTTGYNDSFALFSAFLVFIICLTIACGIIFSFFYGKLASLFIALLLIKTIVDSLLLNQILILLQRKDLLKWILFEQLLYVFYVPIIALISLKRTYRWKGRIFR